MVNSTLRTVALVAFSLVFCMGTALGQSDPKLSIDSRVGQTAGQTVSVPVTASELGDSDIGSLSLEIGFDETAVSFEGLSNKVDDGISPSGASGGEVRVSFFDAENPIDVGSGATLFTLDFTLEGGTSALSFTENSSVTDGNNNAIDALFEGGTVSEEAVATVSVDSVGNVTPGTTVDVPVRASDFASGQQLGVVQLELSYDQSVLTFNGVANGINGRTFDSNDPASGENLSISFFDAGNPISLGSEGKLFDLQFTLEGDTTAVTFTESSSTINDENNDAITTVFADGAVSQQQAPKVNTNAGLTLDEDATSPITTSELSASDPNNSPSEITYDVTEGPENGQLIVDGTAVGGTEGASGFTQQQLADGLVEYSHDGSETTADEFTFSVTDPSGNGPTGQTFSITVNPVNDVPEVVANEELTVDEGGGSAITTDQLSASDPDDGPSDLTFTVTDAPANGQLTVDGTAVGGAEGASGFTQQQLADGLVEYSHDGSDTGTDSFTFNLSDSEGEGPTGETFSVAINKLNDAPTISEVADQTIEEDEQAGPISFTVGDEETSPSDLSVEGSSDNADLVPDDSIETGGEGADRTVTVTPSADSFGTATIELAVTDQEVDGKAPETTTESFELTVESVNDGPVAVADTFDMTEDGALRVSAPNGVLANDRHPDGESFSASEALVSTPDNGDLTLSTDGSFEYIPDENFGGETDQFEYEISDGDSTDTALVDINVEQVNDAPAISEVADQTIEEDEQAGPISFTVGDVETSPSDLSVEGSSDNADLVPDDSIETGGEGADRTVTVTPSADSFGTATIELAVTDQEVDGKAPETTTESFELTVESVNDAPVVDVNDGLSLEEGATAPISTGELSASDVEDGPSGITFEVTGGPENGTLLVGGSAASSFTQEDLESAAVSYKHDGSETTADSLTFDLSDTAGAGPTGQTFAIDVQPVNDAPEVATNEGLTVEEAGSATIGADSLSASDPDDGAEALTFEVTSGPENGALTVEGDTLSAGGEASSFTQADLEAGSVAYSHDDSETTADSFTFDLSDAAGEGPEGQTFDITVQPVDDGPVISGLAEADTTIDEDSQAGPIGFTIGDDETAPENLTIETSSDNPDLVPGDSIETGGEGADRTVTVTPTADSNGTADITVTVVNGGDQSASQTFAVEVAPVNDAPVVSGLPETETIDEDSQAGPIEFAVSNPDDDTFELSAESGNPGLVPGDSIEIDRSGANPAVTITPSADSNGTADITITATDEEGASDSSTLSLEVRPVNDAPVAVNDEFETNQGEDLRVSAPEGLLANDRHPDGESFSASEVLVSTPDNGDVTLSADGSFEYRPETGFAGTEQFVYEISDGELTDTATVTVDVQAVDAVVSGTVTYPGEGDSGLTDGRPLGGVPVDVSTPSGDVTARDTTGSDGAFSVTVQAGEYVVEARPEATLDVPSEINATDASRTVQAFLGNDPFAGDFQREVADVNESGSINATDALKMALFFGNPDETTFEAGEWAATARTVDATGGTDADVSVLAAAYGDANLSGGEGSVGGTVAARSNAADGSVAASAAEASGESNLRSVGMEKTFEVPVRLDRGAKVSSYSLQVGFPAETVSFEGVAGAERDVIASAENGTVRLSWFDRSGESPMQLGSGSPVVTLRFRADASAEKGTVFSPEITAGELAGPSAEPLQGASLAVESVEIGSVLPEEFALKGNYPNPVSSGQATIEMDLPSKASVTVEVYNTLGQKVQTVERSMAAGAGQTIRVDGSKLASGQYFYRVSTEADGETVQKTGRMTVVR